MIIQTRYLILALVVCYMLVGTMEYNDCINYGVCP